MILAAGLTPAWQQILEFERFQPGEVNRAERVSWCASGKVLNIGIALSRLTSKARTLALVGGASGAAIRREFEESRIAARWIDSAAPTRICTTILDRSDRATTELVENSPSIPSAEQDLFAAAFRQEAADAEVIVLAGSLPAGTPQSYYRDVLSSAVSAARVILDVRGPELLAALECGPFLVKPNRRELESTFGRDTSSDGALLSAMRELNKRGAEWVLVTQGKEPAWATSAQAIYRLYPPEAETVNPIGCGDCLAAGVAWALVEKREPLDAFRIGMGAAADNLSQLLPARIDRARVQALAERVDVTAIV